MTLLHNDWIIYFLWLLSEQVDSSRRWLDVGCYSKAILVGFPHHPCLLAAADGWWPIPFPICRPLFDFDGHQLANTDAILDCRRLVGQLLCHGRCCVVMVCTCGTQKRRKLFWGRNLRHVVGKR